MEAETTAPHAGTKKPPRSSQRRARTKTIAVHTTPDEYAALVAKATAAGLSAGGYLRACGFGKTTPGTKRRTPVDRALFNDAISALNRTGNNLNQIARAVNRGDPVTADDLTTALRGYAAALTLLMQAATGATTLPAERRAAEPERARGGP